MIQTECQNIHPKYSFCKHSSSLFTQNLELLLVWQYLHWWTIHTKISSLQSAELTSSGMTEIREISFWILIQATTTQEQNHNWSWRCNEKKTNFYYSTTKTEWPRFTHTWSWRPVNSLEQQEEHQERVICMQAQSFSAIWYNVWKCLKKALETPQTSIVWMIKLSANYCTFKHNRHSDC